MGRHAAATPVDGPAGPARPSTHDLQDRRPFSTGPITDPLILPESVVRAQPSQASSAPRPALVRNRAEPVLRAPRAEPVLDRTSSPAPLGPKAAVAPAAPRLPKAGQPAFRDAPMLDPLHSRVVPRYVAIELSTRPRPTATPPAAPLPAPGRGGFTRRHRRSLAVCAAAVLGVLASSGIAIAADGGDDHGANRSAAPQPAGQTVQHSIAPALQQVAPRTPRTLRTGRPVGAVQHSDAVRPAFFRSPAAFAAAGPAGSTTAAAAVPTPVPSPAPASASAATSRPTSAPAASAAAAPVPSSSASAATAEATPSTTPTSRPTPTPIASSKPPTVLPVPVPTPAGSGHGRFISGTTRPDASNTGAGVLRPYPTREIYGDVTLTGHEDLVDTIVHGRVSVKGDGNLIENCVILGRPGAVYGGSTWLVNTSSAKDAVIRFSTVRSATTSRQINGIGLRNVTAERNDISRVIDGFDIDPVTPGADVATTIKDNYIHDLMFFAPDPGHGVTPTPAGYSGPWRGVGWSHDDAIQITGGRGLRIVGNSIDARWADDIGTSPLPTYQAELSALMVNSPRGPVSELLMKDNWIDGGQYAINAGGASGSGTFTGNRFGRHVSGVGDRSFTLVFDRRFNAAVSDNVYDDTDAPVTVRLAY